MFLHDNPILFLLALAILFLYVAFAIQLILRAKPADRLPVSVASIMLVPLGGSLAVLALVSMAQHGINWGDSFNLFISALLLAAAAYIFIPQQTAQ